MDDQVMRQVTGIGLLNLNIRGGNLTTNRLTVPRTRKSHGLSWKRSSGCKVWIFTRTKVRRWATMVTIEPFWSHQVRLFVDLPHAVNEEELEDVANWLEKILGG